MKRVALGDIVQINPRADSSIVGPPETPVSFVPMAAVSEVTRSIVAEEKRTYGEVKKGFTAFHRGDILIAKITPCFENGKIAFASNLGFLNGFGSTEFHVIRSGDATDGKFLYHLLQSPYVLKAGEMRMKGAAGQRRVPKEFFGQLSIPYYALPEQKRIAAILDAADALRAKRREALAKLDTLLQSTFLDLFGDPVTNPMGWEVTPFQKVGKFESGGTPSKQNSEFWDGSIPWVSPKDMKRRFIDDSIDHISQTALDETSLKLFEPGKLLLVVRGMILAHSVPIASNRTSITINQDMKAITPSTDFVLEYLMAAIDASKGKILTVISTAGHGTKRFDSEAMKALSIPLPPLPLQQKFATIVESVERQKTRHRAQLAKLDDLFASLQARAFAGEL